jgi:hypothetical protein
MITSAQSDFIRAHAYIPEHITDYVTAISHTEPYMAGPYLFYYGSSVLIFVGYPMGEPFDEKRLTKVLQTATREFKPVRVAFIGPAIPPIKGVSYLQRASDTYFRLDVTHPDIPPKVRNMVRRAAREVTVTIAYCWHEEYLGLVKEFLRTHQVLPDMGLIFQRLPHYVSASKNVLIIEARNRDGRLAAFDIAEFGSREYAFYMFNVRSKDHDVPGTSDLLLKTLIGMAREQGKKFVNLGLGISRGVAFFKKKWRGPPFLIYEYGLYEPGPRNTAMDALFDKL